MKMNPEIKKKWVDALRSGKYNQCKGKLWDGEDSFCCLGVLSDIYREEMKEERSVFFNRVTEQTGSDLLPANIAEWAEIPEENCIVEGSSTEVIVFGSGLSRLNDTGASFSIIADIIQGNL